MNTTETQSGSSLQRLVSRHCAHIRKPYTLEEICEQVAGEEYNAELMLQHLLLWCSAGLLFKDAQKMRVVRTHETFAETWWCEGVDEEVGLWAYSEQFILKHSLPNAQALPQGGAKETRE